MTNTAGAPQDPPGTAPAERVVARLRPHARVLFWPTIVLFVICGVTGYLFGNLPEEWHNITLLSGASLAVLLLWFLPLLGWLNRRYTITTRRVILRRGFFVRSRQELLHSRGYDVTVRRTWLQSAFRSGDVQINSGPDNTLILKDVPSADLVQKALHDLIEASRVPMGPRPFESSALTDESTFWRGR